MPPLSILYVEDNRDVREAVSFLLEGSGRDVTSCERAATALAAAEQRSFEVVVTDVSLPDGSGMDLARRLLAKNPLQWVVLCTGYDFPSALPALGPHVTSLRKPFEPDELESLLQRIERDLGRSGDLPEVGT